MNTFALQGIIITQKALQETSECSVLGVKGKKKSS